MKKRTTAAKRAAMSILVAAAQAMTKNMIRKYGGGYRLSDLLNKVRELTKLPLVAKELLNAMKDWFDEKVVKFNNRYLVPTAKGLPKISKLVAT